jgi:hypothetical protein
MPVRPMVAARLVLPAVAAWLCTGTAAWAGGGGPASAKDNAQFINIVCTQNPAAINQSFCNSVIQKLPTVNQLVLEAAAILGETPDSIRTKNFSSSAIVFDAGKQNPFFYQSGQPLNGLRMPYTGLASQLGFIAGQGHPPQPIDPASPMANSFLSAMTTPTTMTPTTLDLTFDFKPRTNPTFALGEDVGDITLPLVFADGSGNLVRDIMATVQIRGTGGTTVTTDIVDDFPGGQTTLPLSALGITSSLNVTASGLEFDLGIPLLITSDLTAFPPSGPGFVPANSGFPFNMMPDLFDGIDPIASFFDASFEDNVGNLLAAVNADLAIAFDASALLSAPIPAAAPEPSSLALLGGGLAGLAFLRRRRRTAG